MRPDPYRLFFPLGLLFALAGALPWPLYALGRIPYPGALHRVLMIQGFELCFVAGFMLTALSGLTHGGRYRPWELAASLAGALLFALGAALGREALAQAGFVLALAVLAAAAGTRARSSGGAAPGEIVFIVLGLALGLTGGLWQLGVALGLVGEPAPGLALRLVSLGMVLGLVLGVGGLLVPTFIGTRDALRIPRVAGPHERRGRLLLYAGLGTLLVLSFAVEGLGHAAAAAWLRVAVGTPMLLLVWKIQRLPGRRTRHAFTLWAAGWFVLAGLWAIALAPQRFLAGEHVVFVGGFGLLTLGIATRVSVVHGGFPFEMEERVLGPLPLASLLLAAAARVAAEFAGVRAPALLGTSGARRGSWRTGARVEASGPGLRRAAMRTS